jgi:rRNA-processing protein FCF1
MKNLIDEEDCNMNRAVIDTCVLYDALIINYLRYNTDKQKHADWNLELYQGKKELEKNYPIFLSEIKIFITTSHVIGELQRHILNTLHINDKNFKSFWEVSIDYLKNKNLDVLLISLLDISIKSKFNKLILDIGYVDTGLIELAQMNNLKIVTNDIKTLTIRANNVGVKVYNPKVRLANKY